MRSDFRAISRTAILMMAPGLGGCGDYVPPLATPGDPQAFATDLDACQAAGRDGADFEVKKRGHSFFAYPVSFPLAERRLITECMLAHGYRARDDG